MMCRLQSPSWKLPSPGLHASSLPVLWTSQSQSHLGIAAKKYFSNEKKRTWSLELVKSGFKPARHSSEACFFTYRVGMQTLPLQRCEKKELKSRLLLLPQTSAPQHKPHVPFQRTMVRRGWFSDWGPGTSTYAQHPLGCVFSSLKGSHLFGMFFFMICPSLLISIESS